MELAAVLRATEGGVMVPVRVHPGARKNAVSGLHDGALKISLTSPPVEGKANAALTEFLAELFGVARREVVLLSGETSRSKRLLVRGVSVQHGIACLERVLQRT
ncbi:MAG: DUF167 domain-containing protein [Acidobacteriaceae bacterium]|nr:DUF167 domain-containing protein [Acidobacteriaceae bacterium]